MRRKPTHETSNLRDAYLRILMTDDVSGLQKPTASSRLVDRATHTPLFHDSLLSDLLIPATCSAEVDLAPRSSGCTSHNRPIYQYVPVNSRNSCQDECTEHLSVHDPTPWGRRPVRTGMPTHGTWPSARES